MKKRILVVGASSGWGHMKAAHNITSALRSASDVWETHSVDIFEFLPFGFEYLTNGSWRFASQYLDPAYSRLYKYCTSRSAGSLLPSRFIERMADRLASRLALEEVNVYVATHSVAAAVGACLKPRYQFKLCVATTDFLLHSFQIYPCVDFFYVPPCYELNAGREESEFLVGKTVETGIPIASEFGRKKDKGASRRKLGLCDTLSTALVSFGGEGLKASRHIGLFDQLLGAGFPLQFIVLAGRNTQFFRAMQERYGQSAYRERIRVYQYKNDVSDFYSASDIFIGKAGGLSISEALSSGLPIVFVDMLPGQEEFNVRKITSLGLGHYVPRNRGLTWWNENLMFQIGNTGAERLRSFGRPFSSGAVADHIGTLAL